MVKRGALEGRIDPSWYDYLNSLVKFRYPILSLKKLLLGSPQYGANEIGIERESIEQPRYIRITDINEFGELEDILGKTAIISEEKYFLKTNDLLIARSGNTVGKSYLHKTVNYECFFAGYMIRFKIDSSKVLPDYIFTFTQTNIYKLWVNAIQRSTGQPNINAEEYKSLGIPVPNTEIQAKIVNIYSQAHETKRQKEAQAKVLLESIDAYLLEKLGIILPEKEEIKPSFFTRFKSLQGERFDPFYHKIYFQRLINAINKSKYKVYKLGDEIKEINYGASFSNEYVENGVPLLRIKDLRRNEIVIDKIVYLPESARNLLGNSFVKTNDFLISRSGTIGVVSIVPKNIDGFAFGSFMIKFNLKENSLLDRNFLSYYLNCKLLIELIEREKIGAVQGNITIPIIKSILVPIPPLPIQKEIADHITNIRQQAKTLQNEAKTAIEEAKRVVEAIILGDKAIS